MRSFFTLQVPLLAALLLMLANLSFGFYLHDHNSHPLVWVAVIAHSIIESSILSIAWRPTRNFILLGFKSDVGYTLMALSGASFAVIIATWIKLSSYFLLMLAAALLLRIRLHTQRQGAIISFLAMLSASLLGLAISWLPTWISQGKVQLW